LSARAHFLSEAVASLPEAFLRSRRPRSVVGAAATRISAADGRTGVSSPWRHSRYVVERADCRRHHPHSSAATAWKRKPWCHHREKLTLRSCLEPLYALFGYPARHRRSIQLCCVSSTRTILSVPSERQATDRCRVSVLRFGRFDNLELVCSALVVHRSSRPGSSQGAWKLRRSLPLAGNPSAAE
jgi:hypothetical protein